MNAFELEFTEFIRHSYPKAEVVVDKLTGRINFKNTDYFFNNRRIICELKCLEKEGYGFIHKTLQDLLNKKEISLFKKGMTIGEALKGCTKENEIQMKLYKQITSSLEGAVKNANRQIRETRVKFDLTNSEGVILLVNLDNTGLEPFIARDCIHRLILKEDSFGNYRYKEFSTVMYISHVHFQPLSKDKTMMPFFVMSRKDKLSELENQFLSEFGQKWSEFMRLPVDNLQDMTSGDVLKAGTFLPKEKNLKSLIKDI